MLVFSRWATACVLLSAVTACGCARIAGGDVANNGPMEQPDKWWKANKDDAVFHPGKGFAVAGTPGYFDANGRQMRTGATSIASSTTGGVQPANYSPAPAAPKSDLPEKKKGQFDEWYENFDPRVQYEKSKRAVAGQPTDKQSIAQQHFTEAEALFREKKFSAAAKKYALAAKFAQSAAMQDDAMFMQGESHFFADEYPGASDAYDALVKEYPNSRHLDEVVARQFSIARFWQQYDQSQPDWPLTPNVIDKTRHLFDTIGHARRTYQNIRLNDPTGPLADDALMALANSHFLDGRWEEADYFYTLLRKEYPKSEHQFDAHRLGLQCKVRRYQGHDYDGTPLEEGEEIAEQLLKQFPDQLRANPQEREQIVKTRREIAASLALRDWNRAEYNATRKNFGAARFYYQQLIDEYPTTKIAQQARARLDTYANEPAVAPQKLPWLVNLFPDSSDAPKIALPPQSADGSVTR